MDADLKPWLLEVNLSPALNVDSQTDMDVKGPLLEDLLDLIDVKQECAVQARLHAQEYLHQSQKKRSKSTSCGIFLPGILSHRCKRKEKY